MTTTTTQPTVPEIRLRYGPPELTWNGEEIGDAAWHLEGVEETDAVPSEPAPWLTGVPVDDARAWAEYVVRESTAFQVLGWSVTEDGAHVPALLRKQHD